MSGEATEVRVRVPGRDPGHYAVRVEPGGLERLGEHCRDRAPAHRYAVLSDERVGELYGGRALEALRGSGCAAELFTFPEGEGAKRRERWEDLTDRLLEAGYGRDSAVVALGGGVTGDLAGFVAATYMRGIPVVQVPTTLLAMVDSSVGGKTGVDTGAGKNLVGAFHHPAFVLADPRVLETLPEGQRAAGLAEAVKAAAIADPELFGWLEEHAGEVLAARPGPTARLLRRAVEIKAEVVAEDPEEAGRRAVLNFGHTVGHALESLAGYELLHGRAVAAGMRVEARLGEVRGVTDPGTARRIAELLDACGHTDRPEEGRDAEELYRAARVDKKGRAGEVRCVLLERIGAVARREDGGWTHPLPRREGLEGLGAALR